MRWRLKLEEYDFKITYKSGANNKNADALSQNPPTQSIHLTLLPILKKRRLNPGASRPWIRVEVDDSDDDRSGGESVV